MNKIVIISLITIAILACATAVTLMLKPQMHKTIQMEQIIYKYRSK